MTISCSLNRIEQNLRPFDLDDLADAFTRCQPHTYVRPEADPDTGDAASFDSERNERK
jgi:hypothetical protein